MKKFLLFLVFVLMFVNAAGCISINEVQSSSGSSDGASNSCDKPPKVLEWSGKSYHLKAENTLSEPGMKFGFIKCDKGKFTLGDADNAFTVYSVGNPETNNDIIFTGNWGRALYSMEITIIEPVIIADGTTELNGDGTKETIRVWLMKGKEVTDPNPGAFQGTFLQGQFEVVATASDGKELARFGLNDAFDGGELSFRKDKPFMLQFVDYNGDGYPDFTIGQWGSSNGNIYSMLTIGSNGFRILEKNIFSSDHRGSIRYRKVGDHAFANQYYDQQKGSLDVIYRWKDGAFSLDAPVGAKEVHPAGMEDGEVAEKTVRINDPASWVVKTIPADNDRNVPSNIKTLSIEFDRAMDPNSLTPSSIIIVEGKHGHMLQEGYEFIYDTAARTLTLSNKAAQFSFGSSNYVDITLSKDIKNIKGEKMGVNVQFGFAVP